MTEVSLSNKQIIDKWLTSYQTVVVFIKTGDTRLVAPQDQLLKPSFSLSLSHFYDRPLFIKEHTVESELSFDDYFFKCVIPWESIWAAYPEGMSNMIHFWNENSPGDGWDQALIDYLRIDQPVMPKVAEKPSLSLVKDEDGTAEKNTNKKNRANLKLVK